MHGRLAPLLLLLGLAAAWPAAAADPVHVGVATCAGSLCHGAVSAGSDSSVQQNEYDLWRRQDAHSNAYRLLQSDAGKRIAGNLGLASATGASQCLACHSDYVPKARRGRRFQLSDGVGCEACHGGAEKWLGAHIAGGSHADNLVAGLRRLEDPQVRAGVCADCHTVDAGRGVDHRLFGAGHPPLEFELDSFLQFQPAHFRVDADYRKRKGGYSHWDNWVAGQLLIARRFLDDLAREEALAGFAPEFSLLDCNSCHHPMRPPRWTPPAHGAGPGHPRLRLASLQMIAAALRAGSEAAAKRWDAELEVLLAAPGREPVRRAGAALRAQFDTVAVAVGGIDATPDGVSRVRKQLIEQARTANHGDETLSRQTYFALESLAAELTGNAPPEPLRRALDGLFEAVDTPFDGAAFQRALPAVDRAFTALPGA